MLSITFCSVRAGSTVEKCVDVLVAGCLDAVSVLVDGGGRIVKHTVCQYTTIEHSLDCYVKEVFTDATF